MAFNPVINHLLCDFAVIGGVLSPGIIPPGGVKGFPRKGDWDVKKQKGSHGATITFQGNPPGEGSIEFDLWRSADDGPDFVDDFEQWSILQAVLDSASRSSGKKDPTAIPIVHPLINGNGYYDVVVQDYTPLTSKGAGLWTVTVSFLEFFPVKPAGSGTPTGSKATSGWYQEGGPPTAESQEDVELQTLLKKAKE